VKLVVKEPGFFAFEETMYAPTSCHGEGGKGQDQDQLDDHHLKLLLD